MDVVHAPHFGCNVYAAGLPPDLNDQQLHDLFAPYGPITSARIMREKATRASKGYGFVLFEDIKSASQAVTALNGLIMGGHRMQVRLAHPDASSTLRKFTKRANSSTSSNEHSATVSPVFQGLSTPTPLPVATNTAPAAMVPANYPFAAAVGSTNSLGNNYNSVGGATNPIPTVPQLFTAATLTQLPSGAAVAAAGTTPPTHSLGTAGLTTGPLQPVPAFGTQPFILPQQPVYIVVLNQDGQPIMSYPM